MPKFKFNTIIQILLLSTLTLSCTHIFSVRKSEPDTGKLSASERLEYEYVLNEAIRLKLMGHIKEAEELFLRCIEINPNSDVAYYELANISYFNEKVDNAIEYSKKALENNRNNKWYYVQLAQFYYQNNMIEHAIKVYAYLTENIENGIEPYYILAQLYFENKQFIEGLEIYEVIEEKIGLDFELTHDKKEIYIKLGEFEKAYKEIKKLIEVYPDNYQAYKMMADFYSRIGMEKEAFEKYNVVISLNPEDAESIINLAFYNFESGKHEKGFYYLRKAMFHDELDLKIKNDVLFSSFDYIDVKQYNQELKEITQHLLKTGGQLLQTYAVVAEFYIRTENYENALKYIQKLVDEEPENTVFREQKLYVLSYMGDHQRIIEEAEKALKYNPDDPLIFYFLGFANYVLDNKDDALYNFKNSLEYLNDTQSSLAAQILAYIGEVYNAREMYQESDIYFKKSIETDPDNLVTLNNYAYFLSLRGEKLTYAERLSRKAVDGQSNNYAFLDTYAWIMYKLADYETALLYIKESYRNNGSENYEILDHYGDILYKLKKIDEAVKKWNKAIEFGGNEEELRIKIENAIL